MKAVCATCERPFDADDVLERDGLTFIFGVGIEYKGAKLKLPRAEHRILRQLMTRRFVAHETLIAEICREETENAKGSLKVRIQAPQMPEAYRRPVRNHEFARDGLQPSAARRLKTCGRNRPGATLRRGRHPSHE
jgi:hypothetical protein